MIAAFRDIQGNSCFFAQPADERRIRDRIGGAVEGHRVCEGLPEGGLHGREQDVPARNPVLTGVDAGYDCSQAFGNEQDAAVFLPFHTGEDFLRFLQRGGNHLVIRQAEEVTKDCDRLYLQIALSYGGRDEIVRAAEAYARDVLAGKAKADSLTEEAFGSYLYTAGVPDMDLVIRTGGDQRLSNFFPWQSTYADLWFTDTLWPDFSEALLKEALDYYRTVKINKGK